MRLEGFAEYESENNDVYASKWEDGVLSEQKNKLMYEDGWQNRRRNGYGIRVYADGTLYEGEWKDDKRDGYGICIYPDSSVYKGEWKDDKRNGHGIQIYSDESIYEGKWKDDKKDGEGIYVTDTWNNSKKYRCVYKDGELVMKEEIHETPHKNDIFHKIEKLVEMRNKKMIGEEEFFKEKYKLICREILDVVLDEILDSIT